MANDEIYSFNKNAEETVRVSLTEFKGHKLLEIRIYVRDQRGGLVPTRKGLSLSRDLAGELFEAIRIALEIIEGIDGKT